MSRNKEPGEDPPPAGTTKLPKSYYSQITCTLCKVKGHNRRTCARRSKTSTSQPRAHVPNDNLAENVMNENLNSDGNIRAEQESMENSLQQLSPQNGDVQVTNDSLIMDVHFNVPTQQVTAQMKRGKLTARKPQNGPNEGDVRPIWKP
ncbi:uncharacterized protein LOC133737627 [Rosa rugosa]|uniref:uncharacterized protein LOC133737627 n=1 Tax=Rosa rugosa TaxID=74645 RepID=UPI002B403D69|nr:uncharacterized protein LOC133737627 [Rosa rugosa]